MRYENMALRTRLQYPVQFIGEVDTFRSGQVFKEMARASLVNRVVRPRPGLPQVGQDFRIAATIHAGKSGSWLVPCPKVDFQCFVR